MSYHVFTASQDGPAHRGAHEDKQDARAALRAARAGIITSSTGIVLEIRSQTPPVEQRALESFARAFFAAPASTPAAPPAPTPKALRRPSRKAFSQGVVSPEDWPVGDVIDEDHPEVSAPPSPPLATLRADDDGHHLGVGATTEAPLPVPFEAPVVDSTLIPVRPFTSPAFAQVLHTAKVAGPLHEEIERLQVALAEATARAVGAEASLATERAVGFDAVAVAAEQTRKARAATEALATIAKALRIPAHRDPAEIAQRALASIKTYALDAKVQGAEIQRLQNVVVEIYEENKKLHAKLKRSTRGTAKAAPRVAGETPVEFFHRYINERAAGVGR